VTKRAKDGGEVTLTREGRDPFSFAPDPGAIVDVVQRAAEPPAPDIAGVGDDEVAVAVAQVRLGGEVAAVGEAGKPYRCPPRFPTLGALQAHCYVLHGEIPRPADGKGTEFERLAQAHRGLHDAEPSRYGEAHTHDLESS
jgi:hypothetical protein